MYLYMLTSSNQLVKSKGLQLPLPYLDKSYRLYRALSYPHSG
nr:MAG TPA: hypothetical protein [Caudoviricetes sp.]DAV60198.1 MAG TPA: hypothetical protein [Caudoviricetes sp.]